VCLSWYPRHQWSLFQSQKSPGIALNCSLSTHFQKWALYNCTKNHYKLAELLAEVNTVATKLRYRGRTK
jgi:hypothetical protein